MSSAGIRIDAGTPRRLSESDVMWPVDRPTVLLAHGSSTLLRFTLLARDTITGC